KYHILAFHPFVDGDILYISEADYRIVCLDLKNRSVQFVAFSLPCCRAFPFFLPWWQTRLSDLKKLDEANSMNPGVAAQDLRDTINVAHSVIPKLQ
ncbi:hypothetical protein Tsubulata_020843, partial [Turnera subulata]